jgi:hypothetical protein
MAWAWAWWARGCAAPWEESALLGIGGIDMGIYLQAHRSSGWPLAAVLHVVFCALDMNWHMAHATSRGAEEICFESDVYL